MVRVSRPAMNGTGSVTLTSTNTYTPARRISFQNCSTPFEALLRNDNLLHIRETSRRLQDARFEMDQFAKPECGKSEIRWAGREVPMRMAQ